MDRTVNYIAVAEHRWQRYLHAIGIEKRLLHVELFYTGAPFRSNTGGVSPGERVVLHPLLDGDITPGYAKGERRYADETRNVDASRQGYWS